MQAMPDGAARGNSGCIPLLEWSVRIGFAESDRRSSNRHPPNPAMVAVLRFDHCDRRLMSASTLRLAPWRRCRVSRARLGVPVRQGVAAGHRDVGWSLAAIHGARVPADRRMFVADRRNAANLPA